VLRRWRREQPFRSVEATSERQDQGGHSRGPGPAYHVSVGTFVYFAIAITLCAFGFVAIFSVGAPFFLSGAAMLVASPWRERRDVLWPVVAAPWAFTVTYILLAPLGCTATGTAKLGGQAVWRTECSNILGINYSGGGSYDPPLLPALLAGLVVAGLTVAGLRRLLARRRVDA
jgi:hypothetical protein